MEVLSKAAFHQTQAYSEVSLQELYMLIYSLMKPEGILLLEPHGPLTEQDFDGVSQDVDEFLQEHPKLHGVMVQAKDFPGWENWAGFSAHMGFVRDHRKQVEQIALVTDSHLAGMAEFVGKHFTHADVRISRLPKTQKPCSGCTRPEFFGLKDCASLQAMAGERRVCI